MRGGLRGRTYACASANLSALSATGCLLPGLRPPRSFGFTYPASLYKRLAMFTVQAITLFYLYVQLPLMHITLFAYGR